MARRRSSAERPNQYARSCPDSDRGTTENSLRSTDTGDAEESVRADITFIVRGDLRVRNSNSAPVAGWPSCHSPISRPGRKSLTCAQRLARLQAMRETLRTLAALRSALSTRRDLLFENLALRHQLGVLARSDRHFRPGGRLLWLCFRRYGLAGGTPWSWSGRPRSPGGIAKGSVDTGAAARGSGREGRV
jgi:hypothetical protein